MTRNRKASPELNGGTNASRYGSEISFQVLERIGTIASYKSKWQKELNLIQWNDRAPKLDIRDWDEAHEHMSRGITLHEEEAVRLMELLMERFGRGGQTAETN